MFRIYLSCWFFFRSLEKINLSTGYINIAPIRLATIVAHISPREDNHIRQIAKIGVDNCHRIMYNKYFLIIAYILIQANHLRIFQENDKQLQNFLH